MRIAVVLVSLALVGVALLLLTGASDDEGYGEPLPRPAPSPGPGAEPVIASPSVAGAPVPADEVARLAGAPGAGVEQTPEPVRPIRRPPVCLPGQVAAMLVRGTRIERLWGEHILGLATEAEHRRIGEARAELERAEAEPLSKVETTRIGLRLTLLRIHEKTLRDCGIDVRGVPYVCLDPLEVQVLERAERVRAPGYRVEDEVELPVSDGESANVFLASSDPWPRDAERRMLPLGVVTWVRVASTPDLRYLALSLTARSATLDVDAQGPEDQRIAVRAVSTDVYIPDGGAMLVGVRDPVWLPASTTSADERPESEYYIRIHVAPQ